MPLLLRSRAVSDNRLLANSTPCFWDVPRGFYGGVSMSPLELLWSWFKYPGIWQDVISFLPLLFQKRFSFLFSLFVAWLLISLCGRKSSGLKEGWVFYSSLSLLVRSSVCVWFGPGQWRDCRHEFQCFTPLVFVANCVLFSSSSICWPICHLVSGHFHPCSDQNNRVCCSMFVYSKALWSHHGGSWSQPLHVNSIPTSLILLEWDSVPN